MSKLRGLFIKSEVANTEINEYLSIRDETHNHIGSKLQELNTSQNSRVYFKAEEISFIFERELIEKLFSETESKGCNALRVYYAADPDKDGSPTVVLVAAKFELNGTDELINVENVFSDDENNAAIEYPGGGTKEVGPPVPIIDIRGDDLAARDIEKFNNYLL